MQAVPYQGCALARFNARCSADMETFEGEIRLRVGGIRPEHMFSIIFRARYLLLRKLDVGIAVRYKRIARDSRVDEYAGENASMKMMIQVLCCSLNRTR
jgi:hypothetical protein